MVKNPKIILLDEPTSALDSVSEELVSQAMQELFKDRTVIIIAHRLQTVKHADRILYIDKSDASDVLPHEGRGTACGGGVSSSDLTPNPSALDGIYPTREGSKILEQ